MSMVNGASERVSYQCVPRPSQELARASKNHITAFQDCRKNGRESRGEGLLRAYRSSRARFVLLFELAWTVSRGVVISLFYRGLHRLGVAEHRNVVVAICDGVVRDGAVRDGIVRDGIVRDGIVRDGIVRDGALGEGVGVVFGVVGSLRAVFFCWQRCFWSARCQRRKRISYHLQGRPAPLVDLRHTRARRHRQRHST